MRKSQIYTSNQLKGFTLLELLLVLTLIGLAATYVVYTAFGNDQKKALENQTQRLNVVLNMASDYAVLNQTELGLRIDEDENQYLFLRLDEDNKWQIIVEASTLTPHTLPEEFSMSLKLDEFPWDEGASFLDNDSLFEDVLTIPEDGVDIGEEEEQPPEPPQIILSSSGEITPFSLVFAHEPDFGNAIPTYFQINNKDFPPFEVLGPLEEIPE